MSYKFAHLHVHSEYSFLDGANRIDKLVDTVAKSGFYAVALTDHGNLCGVPEFFKKAQAAGIKPIVGCELYVEGDNNENHHLTVLVQNEIGWKNMCMLATRSFTENFYYKPRVKKEWLLESGSGIIVLSGCLASELASKVLAERYEEADKLLEWFRTNFDGRFFLELQPHNIQEQRKYNEYLVDRAKLLGLPTVVTNDVHYPTEDYHFAQEVLMCISTRKTVDDPTRLRHDGLRLHFKTPDEIEDELRDLLPEKVISEAILNTVTIADSVTFEIRPQRPRMPRLKLEKHPVEVLRELAEEGFKTKLKLEPDQISVYRERLEFELDQIQKMGFVEYFLVVQDFINWAKSNGIPVGPGRGSVAGSLVAYLIGITEIDPIKNKLLFERFLNPDRVSLPDVDVDFCYEQRDKVIEYVKNKYGHDHVAAIATFGTLKAKAAIKDVGRALGFSFSDTEKIAQLIPAPRQGFDFSLEESLKLEPKLKKIAEDPKYKQLIEIALKLEGLARHSSKHAAGVVISGDPIREVIPLMIDKEQEVTTQFSMHYLEDFGLIKYDFLGLETLTFINSVLRLIKCRRGMLVDLNQIPLDDPATFDLLARGDTVGVFQLESGGIREMLRRLKPRKFEDIVALLALYRPGPLESGMGEKFILRKNGVEPIEYLHPRLEPILSETYGIILYQEQIMQIAQTLAGYTLAQADILRKAMGKKNPEEMQKQRDRFVSGCRQAGISEELANTIFDQMETFARYGFNKSHSAAYALISYRAAYLKAHFTEEFIATLLSFKSSDSEKVYEIINHARDKGVRVMPPDINVSGADFKIESGYIYFSLTAIKGVSTDVAKKIVEDRERNGSFTSFENFLQRTSQFIKNRKIIESLIKAGCFDSFNKSRSELIKSLSESRKLKPQQKARSLFEQIQEADNPKLASCMDRQEILLEKLALEREALGFYVSAHPLDFYNLRFAQGSGYVDIKDLGPETKGALLVAVAQNIKFKSTKKGERYAVFFLEDKTGVVEAVCWPRVLREFEDILLDGKVLCVRGNCQPVGESKTFIVEHATLIEDALAQCCKRIDFFILESEVDSLDPGSLFKILQKHLGNVPLVAHLCNDLMTPVRSCEHWGLRVSPSANLVADLIHFFPKSIIQFALDGSELKTISKAVSSA